MFEFLKNLFASQPSEDSTVMEQPPVPKQPGFNPVPRTAAPAQQSPPDTNGQTVNISLQAVLNNLPLELKGRLRETEVGAATMSVSVDAVLSQLQTGAVKISFGSLRRAAPQLFSPAEDCDETPISLPLGEILSRIDPALLVRRQHQKQVEVPEDINSPFSDRGRGQLYTVTPPKTASTPSPRTITPALAAKPMAPQPPEVKPIQPTATPTQPKVLPTDVFQPKPTPTAPAQSRPIPGMPSPVQPRTMPAAPTQPKPVQGVPMQARPPAPTAVPPQPKILPGDIFQPKSTVPAAPPQPRPAPTAPPVSKPVNATPIPDIFTPKPASTPPPASPSGSAAPIPDIFAPKPAPPASAPVRSTLPTSVPVRPPATASTPAISTPAPVPTPAPTAPPVAHVQHVPPPPAQPIPISPALRSLSPSLGTTPADTTPKAPPTPVTKASEPAVPTASPALMKEVDVVVVPLTVLAESWSEALRHEIVQLNLVDAKVALPVDSIEEMLKRGKVVCSWRTVRSWIKPAPLPSVSAHDGANLELPLKVLTPLFLARQKDQKQQKVSIDENIPNLFFGFPQPDASGAANVSSAGTDAGGPSRAVAKPKDTNYYVWDDTNESARVDETEYKRREAPGTEFLTRYATPNEVVSRAAALDGVAGALVALPDGLMVANKLSPDLNGDTLAAFLPQIFSKVTQCTKELRMGELNNLSFTIGNIPWKIFRVNAIFFAAFGHAGQGMPTAQLAALAAELDHKK